MTNLKPLLYAGTSLLFAVSVAFADDRIGRHDYADGYGTAHYNAHHWILRFADRDAYDRRGIDPLNGPTRYGPFFGGAIGARAPVGSAANPGGLSLARTYDPVRPSAQIIHVSQELKDLAAAREPGRLARLEREIDDIEIRFRSPTQAYDTRFPSIVFLDSP